MDHLATKTIVVDKDMNDWDHTLVDSPLQATTPATKTVQTGWIKERIAVNKTVNHWSSDPLARGRVIHYNSHATWLRLLEIFFKLIIINLALVR